MSGLGLLQIRSLVTSDHSETQYLLLYREPGLGRLQELSAGRLPPMAPVLTNADGGAVAVVTGRKRDWLKIVYDDADREGWVREKRSWKYWPWHQFLKGRIIRPLPGVKKSYGFIREEPLEAAAQLATISAETPLRVVLVDGDWAMVISGLNQSGWVRWRDDNGRFLISIDSRFDPLNR